MYITLTDYADFVNQKYVVSIDVGYK